MEINDRVYNCLGELGYTGSLQDRKQAYLETTHTRGGQHNDMLPLEVNFNTFYDKFFVCGLKAPTTNGVDQSATTTTPINEPADFEVELEMEIEEHQAGAGVAYDSLGLSGFEIMMGVTVGSLVFNNIAGLNVEITGLPLKTPLKIVMRRVGLTLTILVNEVQEFQGVCTLALFTLNTLGRNASSFSKITLRKLLVGTGVLHNYLFNDGYNPLGTIANLGSAGVIIISNPRKGLWRFR